MPPFEDGIAIINGKFALKAAICNWQEVFGKLAITDDCEADATRVAKKDGSFFVGCGRSGRQ